MELLRREAPTFVLPRAFTNSTRFASLHIPRLARHAQFVFGAIVAGDGIAQFPLVPPSLESRFKLGDAGLEPFYLCHGEEIRLCLAP
jgi:hypothetical protein